MKFTIPILLGIALCCSAFIPASEREERDISLLIDPKSTLSISGTSNVVDFECFCKDSYKPLRVKVTRDPTLGVIRFQDAVLNLRTKALDCDNDRMNSDLNDAMKSDDYPNISIWIKHAVLQNNEATDKDGWYSAATTATITITSVRRPVILDVKAKKIGPNVFRFKCSKGLKMTDFGITPPTAMMGLIKVANEIKISFDLTAQLKES